MPCKTGYVNSEASTGAYVQLSAVPIGSATVTIINNTGEHDFVTDAASAGDALTAAGSSAGQKGRVRLGISVFPIVFENCDPSRMWLRATSTASNTYFIISW